jgi:heptaprenyl diphosphate synthase/octaprenyl-diphosphate synthase
LDLNKIYEPIQGDLNKVEEKIKEVSQGKLDWLALDFANGLHEASRIQELLTHILASSGKRTRPALVLLASKFYDYDPGCSIAMAAAIELFHIATLVHDDAIDNSALRRGRPTINSLWGDNAAILLGDYLFAKSAEMAVSTGNRTVARRLHRTLMTITPGELAQAFNAFKLEESRKYYLNRISSKTASLLSLSTECGAILSHAPKKAVTALKDYGFNIGIAFQIVDDILDYIGTTEEMGKPVGSDLREGTITLPVLFLIDRYPNEKSIYEVVKNRNRRENTERVKELIRNSPEIIQDCYQMANEYSNKAIAKLDVLPDKPEKESLTELAYFLVERRR